MYLICVISIFLAMAASLCFMVIGWIHSKKFKIEELIFWLLWFALVMAIVAC